MGYLSLYDAADLRWLTNSDNIAEGISFTLIAWREKSITGKATRVARLLFLSKNKSFGKSLSGS